MNNFIKLTSMVINKLHITQIIQKQSKYYVYMSSNYISGYVIFTSGILGSKYYMIEICETKNKQDYNIITEFINRIY